MSKSKKVANFLLLRPVLTTRNVTSIGLVALFFAVYVMAGGKVTSIPNIDRGENFGGVRSMSSPFGRERATTPAPAREQIKQQAAPAAREQQYAPRRELQFGSQSPSRTAPATSRQDSSASSGNDLSDIESRLHKLPNRETGQE